MTRVLKPAAGGKGALIAIYCSSKNVSENGTELPSATTTLLMMESLSQTSMEQIFQMALTLQYTGTGDDIVDSCVDVYTCLHVDFYSSGWCSGRVMMAISMSQQQRLSLTLKLQESS